MKPRSFLVLVSLLVLALGGPANGAVTFDFGPGVAGLTAAGAGLSKISSADERVAVRFTATKGGPLTEFSFGAIPGPGFASKEQGAFVVTLHADANGTPGKLLARASDNLFNDGGARARTARFAPAAPVQKGTTYHLVIASPGANASNRSFGVTHARLPREVTPMDALTLEPMPSARVLTSGDGGATWLAVEQAIATHEIVIGESVQGWGYTGTFELQLKRGPAGAQYVMQTFTFATRGGERRAAPKTLRLALRPQGALVGKPVKLFAHIVTPVGYHTVAEAYGTATMGDAARFQTVELPFDEDGALVNGVNYILILGLSDEVSVSPGDFIFMRGYNWGIGVPNLTQVSWQGTDGCAHVSSSSNSLGEARAGGDVPFLIDYTPAK